jgi:hypothetical protein
MYSQTQFTPGKKSNSSRMINYIAMYNQRYGNYENLNCICIPDKFDKRILGSDSPSIRVSKNIRTTRIINFTKGGKTQYGNFYLGEPPNVNYLGRIEGMPGGSGSPPVNRF